MCLALVALEFGYPWSHIPGGILEVKSREFGKAKDKDINYLDAFQVVTMTMSKDESLRGKDEKDSL